MLEKQVVPAKGHRRQTNVTVDAAGELIVAANVTRRSVTLQNKGSVTVYIGDSTVTASGATQGFALFAGASVTDNNSTEAWYGMTASSSVVVGVTEVY